MEYGVNDMVVEKNIVKQDIFNSTIKESLTTAAFEILKPFN
jgi:hypothetical protein